MILKEFLFQLPWFLQKKKQKTMNDQVSVYWDNVCDVGKLGVFDCENPIIFRQKNFLESKIFNTVVAAFSFPEAVHAR